MFYSISQLDLGKVCSHFTSRLLILVAVIAFAHLTGTAAPMPSGSGSSTVVLPAEFGAGTTAQVFEIEGNAQVSVQLQMESSGLNMHVSASEIDSDLPEGTVLATITVTDLPVQAVYRVEKHSGSVLVVLADL